jgi:hypothetical protein
MTFATAEDIRRCVAPGLKSLLLTLSLARIDHQVQTAIEAVPLTYPQLEELTILPQGSQYNGGFRSEFQNQTLYFFIAV